MKRHQGSFFAILTLALTALLGAPSLQADVIYIAEQDGTVLRYESAGGPGTVYATGLGYATGLAFDSAGYLYVGNRTGNSISRVAPGGGVGTTWATGVESPEGMAFDAEGNLYVNSITDILAFSPGSNTPSVFASGSFFYPNGLAFDDNGLLYSVNLVDGNVVVTTPEGDSSVFTSGLDYPTGVAFDSHGNMYVAAYGNDRILKYTNTNGVLSTTGTIFGGGVSAPIGLAFDSLDNLYVTNANGGTVTKITPGGLSSVFANIAAPQGIVIVIPEPGTFGLLLIGASALIIAPRRKRGIAA
jgi:hypothetical protein